MTEPTDAELIAFAVETGMRVRTGKGVVSFARAVLARWGQPAQAAEPVAWAFKYDDGTWHDPSTTEHSSGMRPLFAAPQPAHSGVPVAWLSPWRADQVTTDYDAYGEHGIPLYTTPQPVEREPLPGIKPGAFFGGRPEYAMEIDPDDFYGITAAIHHAIEMLNKHKDANTDWSPLDPKRSRRLRQALMAAWILEYQKEAAAHGIKGGLHGTE